MGELKRRLIAGTINRYPAEDGWENVHLDRSGRSLYDLAKRRKSGPAEIITHLADPVWIARGPFDEIRCHQVLEHLTPEEAPQALANFYLAMDLGGRLDIEVPNIARIIGGYVDGNLGWEDLLRNVYGSSTSMPDDHLNAHRWGYSRETLTAALEAARFRVVSEPDPESYQLRLIAER